MSRYSKVIGLVCCILLFSCKRQEFMDDLVGKWRVNEIIYNQNGLVTTDYPTQLTMQFTYDQYATWQSDSLTESGNYMINGALTQVIFWHGSDEYKFKILEHSPDYQHWKRDIPSIGLSIEFKMDKEG